MEYATIMGDWSLMSHVQENVNTKKGTDADDLITANIQENKNADVDKTINYLEQIFKAKRPFNPLSRVGGAAGVSLSRPGQHLLS